MDTSRPPTSAEEQQPQKTRMTSNPHANQYAYQENAYHQKPPSFNHKHVNISLVDDGNNTKKQQQKNKEKQQQAGAGEWRESIPIKLEHLLFNFKENSLKVYKASPPRIMQIIALLASLLLFCGVLALILSQRDDNLKKEANLPSDQSAIAERIIGESKLLNHKLKGSLFDPKNQTVLNEKQKKYSKSPIDAKDAAVRKAFGSLIFSNDDNDEPDQEENNSDESFDGERSHSRNFNLFSSDNERPSDEANKEKQSNLEQSENPRVMLIERLMGMHFGMQPKFGLSESLVIRKTIDDADETNKPENEIDLLLNPKSMHSNSKLSKETSKDTRNEDATPFLLRYAAAAMLSRVLATAQQQAYIQQLQQQQRFREMNEKQMFNSPYKGYRGYRNFNIHESAESSPNYLQREPTMNMYGRPMHPSRHSSRPPMFAQPPIQAPQFGVSSDRGYSRGPLISNEEAESQQIHPIILMLNLPYKDQQTPATSGAQLMLMSPAQSSFAHQAIEPIFMPYAASRQNPYYKQQQSAQREQQIYNPFAHKPFYQPQQSTQQQNSHESGYYSHYTSHPHSYNSMIHQHQHQQPINSNYRPQQPSRTYIQRVPNTIEVPIEIHHQVTPSISPAIAQNAQAQIIVQPQIETAQSQPNDPSNDQDQSGENEHHMVVFYSDADNLSHSEENGNQADNQSNQPQQQPMAQPQQPVFVKESKQINQDLEKANQISKMLLLHFVNPNQPQANQQQADTPNEQPKPFLVQQQQSEKQQNKQEEMTVKSVNKMQDKMKEIKAEEEPQVNDQIKREELLEKQQDQGDSEVEPTSLAHFAQAIRHVIDQQQQNQQNQEQRPIQPIIIEPAQPAAAQQQQPASMQQQPPMNAGQSSFQPVQLAPIRKEPIVENSNKEIPDSRMPENEEN